MPSPSCEQHSAQLATSRVIQDLENDLTGQILGEVQARRELLVRAVAAAEAAVREVYEAKIKRLESDCQGNGMTLAFDTPKGTLSSIDNAQEISKIYLSNPGTRQTSPFQECAVEENAETSISKPKVSPLKPAASNRPAPLNYSQDRTRSFQTDQLNSASVDKSLVSLAALRSNAGKLHLPSFPSTQDFTSQYSIGNLEKGSSADMESSSKYVSMLKCLLTNSQARPPPALANGIETTSFTIKDANDWKENLEAEFGKRRIADHDIVVIKDANGSVINVVTAKAFALDARIPGCLPFPLNFAYDKMAMGNVCCVSSLPLANTSGHQKPTIPLTPARTSSRGLEAILELTQKRRSETPDRRFLAVINAVTAAGRFARSSAAALARSETSSNTPWKYNSTSSFDSAFDGSIIPEDTEGTATLGKHFEFWPTWEPQSVDSEPMAVSAVNSEDSSIQIREVRSITSVSTTSDAALYISSESGDGGTTSSWQRMIMRPTSSRCITWDTLKSIAVLYDLIFIPLSAFTLPEYLIFTIIDVIISCIWVLDIGVSFLRGYIDEKQGLVEMRAPKIALRYFGTWFFFDCLMVVLDISLLTMKQAVSMHGLVSLLPMLRLVRIMKLPSLLSMLSELMGLKANTEKLSFVLRIVRLLVLFLVINHFISCGWYAVGQFSRNHSLSTSGQEFEGWIDEHFGDAASIGYRYATSFHWSLTQFTPASMEVTPNNLVERLYTVCIIVCGFLMFSSFVSTMTQSISQLQAASLTEKRAMRQLRLFIADNRISAETIGKIMSCIHEDKKTVRRTRFHEEDVEALQRLPDTLRRHIRVEMYHSVLQGHPVLHKVASFHLACFKNLCYDAVSQKSVMRGEALFYCGVEASGMYFCTDGVLCYYIGYDKSSEEIVVGDQGGASRLCEGALWLHWIHRGRIVGEEASEFIILDNEQFGKICKHSPLVSKLRLYASYFASWALRSHGDPQSIRDTWGADYDVQRLAQSAFMTAANPMVRTFLGVCEIRVVFRAWKDWTLAQRRMHNPWAFWGRQHRSFSSISSSSNRGPRSARAWLRGLA